MPLDDLSPYERRAWIDLTEHWEKKAKRREVLPPRVREALGTAKEKVGDRASTVAHVVAEHVPDTVKEVGGLAVDTALAPALKSVADLLELVTDYSAELTKPETVLNHHQKAGREVTSLADLRPLDLADLDEVTRGLTLKWRTFGAGEGAAMGALAMVPIAGGAASITLDIVAMQVLSTAIATHVCYAYGLDAKDPELEYAVKRMIARSFAKQTPKVATQRGAHMAWGAAKNRTNWSNKLREDHRLLEAIEKLMRQWKGGGHVPVGKAAKGLPVVSVVVGAGSNSWILGDVAKNARLYARTLHLAEKYDLELPPNLRELALETESGAEEGPGDGPV